VTTTKILKNGSVFFFFSPVFLGMHDILVDMQSVVIAREPQPSLASLLYYSLLSLYEFGVVEFILCPASARRCPCPLDAGVVKLRSCARIDKFADGDENQWSMHAAGPCFLAAVAWVWRFLSSSSSSLQLGTEILGFPLYIVVLCSSLQKDSKGRVVVEVVSTITHLPSPHFTLEDLELFPGTLLSALQLLDQLLIS